MKTLKILGAVLYVGAVLTILWITADPGKPASQVLQQAPVPTPSATTTTEKTVVPAKTSPSTETTKPKTQTATPASPKTTESPYSMTAVAKHNSETDCWSVINGKIYNLTNWIHQHPGGSSYILSICGFDGSAVFNQQHGGRSLPAQTLTSFFVANVQ